MIRKYNLALTTVGADGSAAANVRKVIGRPGVIRFVAVDYHASCPNTADVVIKSDTSAGTTLFTKTNNATDIAATPVAMPGMDEGGAASAATDLGSGGFPFTSGIYVSIAQANALTNCAIVSVWVEL